MVSPIFFVLILAGMAIVGTYVMAYVGHCILTVVSSTAASPDEVFWAEEPIVDWLARSASLWCLVLIWLVPAGLVARWLSEVWLVDQGALRTLLLAVPGLWLLFPVGLLSSQSAVSRWVFFRPTIAWQMLRIFPMTAAVYLISAVLAALGALVWYAAIFGEIPYLLLLAAPLGAALLLIYARLLGRLAYRIQQLPQPKIRPPVKPASAKKPRVKAKVSDPWPIPEGEPGPTQPRPERGPEPDEIDEWDQDYVRSGYGVSGPGTPKAEAAPQRTRPLDPEEEDAQQGYGLGAEAPASGPRSNAIFEKPAERAAGPRVENQPDDKPVPKKGARKGPGEKKLRWPLVSGVYGFPWRGDTLGAWVWLSFGLLVFGVGLLGLRIFWPGG